MMKKQSFRRDGMNLSLSKFNNLIPGTIVSHALFCALVRREGISPTLVAQESNRSRSAVVHLAKNYGMKVLNREK